MEPSNYLRRQINLLLILFLFAFVSVINCAGNDNEPGLKFTNLSAAKVSGIRGKNYQLSCNGVDSRNEQLNYEWLFNGNAIKDNDSRFIRRSNGTVLEVRKLYLVIKNASKSTGKYNCLISNSIGTIISRNIFLISTTPQSKPNKKNEITKRIKVGDNVRFLCPALSLTSDVWFTWLFNNEPLQETRTSYTLLNSSILHVVSVSKSNEGTYTCIAHCQNSTSIYKNHLVVINAEDDYKYINFLSENRTITNANHGQIVTLECLVNLAKPDARVNWQRISGRNKFFISNAKENGNELTSLMSKRRVNRKRLIGHNDEDEMENSIDGYVQNKKRYSIVGESSLQIENVNQGDEDDYVCSASYTIDEFNITESTVHTLNVFDPPLQVKAAKETKIEAFASRKAKFDCGLIYLPKSTSLLSKPTIKWLKNGVPLETTTRVYTKKDLSEHLSDEDHDKEEIVFNGRKMKLDDLISSQLVISSAQRSDTGYYQCFVESQYETITNEFYLYVNPIGNQPLPPKNIMVNIIGSNEAIVNWSVPMSLSEILGYTVHYQSVSNKMKIKEEKAVTNNNFYHLTNLSAYTNYSLFVRAYSQQNASNDSKVITFLTGEETPVDLPFFKVSVKNKTSALLKWDQMSSADARGKILYYKLQYVEVTSLNEDTRPELIKTINVEGELNEYLITNLKPGSIYRFKVIAGNSKGLPSDDIIEYVDWEQIQMPIVDKELIRLNLNATSTAHDSVKVTWKVEEEDNEKDITHLLKRNIKLVCQNTMKDDDKQIIELRRDQTEYEVVDLEENSHYMIEIEVLFEKGDLQFSEKTLIKTIAKPLPQSAGLPEPSLDNDDLESNNIDTSSSKDSSIDIHNINQPDLSDYSTSSTTNSLTSSTTSTTTTTESSYLTPEFDRSNATTLEIDSKSNGDSKTTKSSIDRIDIDSVSVNEENSMNEKRLIVDSQTSTTSTSTSTTTSSTIAPIQPANELPAYNDSENLLDDFKPKQKLVEENDVNSYRKPTYDIMYEKSSPIDISQLNKTNAINAINDSSKKVDSTRNDINSSTIEDDHNVILNNSTTSTTSTTTTTTTEQALIIDEKPIVASNEIINDKLNDKVKDKDSLPVDSLLNEPKEMNKNEEQIENQNLNNSIDEKINEFKKPFLKRIDKEHEINQTSNQTIVDESLRKEEDKIINNLNQQDNQLKSKLDLFDKIHNETIGSTSTTESTINVTSSSLSTTTTTSSIIEESFTAESFKNRINQILNRNLTKDEMLPYISEFEVTPLNGSTVNCRWMTNYFNENATYTIYYNPVKYLETANYSKNFQFEDDFLFLRTNGTELNITNLLPFTIYDFYITINYHSGENDEDFFYQLNKFLSKKLRNKFYVKHRPGLNQIDKLSKPQSLTEKQKKYEKQFRVVEKVIDEFDNLISFFKGQRKRVRTLEDLPSEPVEFSGIALDSNSVQLSWRLPNEQNGLIKAYEIYFIAADQSSQPIEEWSNLRVNGTDFACIVKQLNASTDYKFMIKAMNNAGLGKSTTRLTIRTLKDNYETYERSSDSDIINPIIEPNTFRYTQDMSYKDILNLNLNETKEILIGIGIGVGCLFGCVTLMAICYKISTPVPPQHNKLYHSKGNCGIKMNDYSKGMKKRKNERQSYLINHQPMSNSNQSVIIYSQSSKQNSVNQEPNNQRASINITPNQTSNLILSNHHGNVSNVQAEVHQHQTGSLQHNAAVKNAKDEITQLNISKSSLNDQNLNCQLQVNNKRNSIQMNGHINGHLNGNIEETELTEFISNSDKSKQRNRRYSEKDKDLNIPLLLNGHSKPYHEYDQPADLIVPIIDDQTRHNCHTESLNSNGRVRKASCNCGKQQPQNGYIRNNLHNFNNEDANSINDELINERRSLV